MKKLILIFILLLVGCSKNNLTCTLTNKDDDHTNDYIINVLFKNEIMQKMTLTGTSTYQDNTTTTTAYSIIKNGYDALSNMDENIITETSYQNNKIYFRLELYPEKLNETGLNYLTEIFNIESGFPTYNDVKRYIKVNNYQCQ